MSPPMMMPAIAHTVMTYGRNSPVTHWTGNPQAITTEEEARRPTSPVYYSTEHRTRDKILEREFGNALRELKKKQKRECWTRLWDLHKDFRKKFNQSYADEKHALELTNDEVVKQNTREKFRRLREIILREYGTDKGQLPVNCSVEHSLESQALRDKYHQASLDLRRASKSELHLQIFQNILAPQQCYEPLVADQNSVDTSTAIEEPAVSNGEGDVPRQVESTTQVLSIVPQQGNQENPESLVSVALEAPTAQKAASVASKKSAASKLSAASATSRRSEQASSIRLQETPLITKTPPNSSTATEQEVRPSSPDPMPVKRNFWGKIINVNSSFSFGDYYLIYTNQDTRKFSSRPPRAF